MSIIGKLTTRLEMIDSHVKTKEGHQPLIDLVKEIQDELRSVNNFIISEVKIQPNDTLKGSVTIKLSTLPKNVVIKVWADSNMFYLAFYNESDDNLPVRIFNTFNEDGLLIMKSLDVVEDRLLDFIANEYYNQKHTVILF